MSYCLSNQCELGICCILVFVHGMRNQLEFGSNKFLSELDIMERLGQIQPQ